MNNDYIVELLNEMNEFAKKGREGGRTSYRQHCMSFVMEHNHIELVPLLLADERFTLNNVTQSAESKETVTCAANTADDITWFESAILDACIFDRSEILRLLVTYRSSNTPGAGGEDVTWCDSGIEFACIYNRPGIFKHLVAHYVDSYMNNPRFETIYY